MKVNPFIPGVQVVAVRKPVARPDMDFHFARYALAAKDENGIFKIAAASRPISSKRSTKLGRRTCGAAVPDWERPSTPHRGRS